jgi:hypothetical protein
MTGGGRKQGPPVEESVQVPEPPNEGATGHHPDEEDKGVRPARSPGRREDKPREDVESEQSFPASDPPANY